ncbi:fimbria/pilus outer membrane usher protein [Aeromonas dhakensis]|uniref:fimbria/pilus outer membrane usher protein n=1 Tax=Aeromonas dhakensis TaxID=196024 RepID=UPI0005B501B5|nr:fimbria/pilus outer membrane usher protein [Aeromonas dhakensis]
MRVLFVIGLYSMLLFTSSFGYVSAVEFNTNLIDSVDKESIDFEQFKSAGYIVPGQYKMQMQVNGRALGEFEVSYLATDDGNSAVCFSQQQLEAIGLKEKLLQDVLASKSEQGCYDLLQLLGVTAQGSLTSYSLTLAVPQAYLNYVADGWDPPSRWDEGVNGAMLDYGINLQQNHAAKTNVNRTSLSAYGVAGFNVSAWRVRADWQGQYSQANGEHENSEFKLNRVYSYRALPDMTAQLKMGEIDLGMSVFDSFQFLGASLTTDESMLPPNLRGYAPEVVGIAKTNAKVVISLQGRTIYETQVAAGPFRIQDLNSYVSGTLDVRVEEQDGTLQTFQVSTASVPYLSRPGFVRYKLASGKASSVQREHDGPAFASGEFSWGVNNGWSLFGGALLSDNYQTTAIGMGRDLYDFGAISVDMTHSWAELPRNERKSGASYRVNYSKNFEEHSSQVTFAGYRFSERDFMNMNDFIEASKEGSYYRGGQKELYTVILSKQFAAPSVGAYLDYSHQTYWNEQTRERVSLSLSSNFDLLNFKGITSSVTTYSSKQSDERDIGFYLSFTVPFGLAKSVGYSVSSNSASTSHNVHFNNRLDDRNNYSLTAGTSSEGGSDSISGFYSHSGDIVDMSVNASHQSGSSSGIGLSLNGGLTAIAEGAALHRGSTYGGSRIMIDTKSADVPISSFGPSTRTNRYGKAVLANGSSYYRNQTNIAVDELSDEVDVIGSPVRSITLTEGAIGYQQFDMLSGGKRIFQLKRANGKYVPMAATVFNRKQQQLGMVADEGMVYLAGLQQGESLLVNWGSEQCELALPTPLPAMDNISMLACR